MALRRPASAVAVMRMRITIIMQSAGLKCYFVRPKTAVTRGAAGKKKNIKKRKTC